MRVVVALAVEVGILAVILQSAVDATSAILALILAPVGYAFSYRRRHRRGIAVKVILAVGLFLALDRFIGQVRFATTIDEARIPLASLFLWVQVLHAFDVPRRRDLAFSMVSSTTLIAAAGALSLTTSFLWPLLGWAILAGAWLWLSARPMPRDLTPVVSIRHASAAGRRSAATLRSAGAAGVAAALIAGVVFMATPRLPASLIRTPPFRLGPHGGTPVPGRSLLDPGLQQAGVDGVVDFAPDAYPGFSDTLDLRSRGQLSKAIAFRVRADGAALWRAQAFDTYDGSAWTAPDKGWRSVPFSAGSGSYDLGTSGAGWGTDALMQTFYVESTQPNVLFAAANAERVYFPSGGLQVNSAGAIRAPILLDPGTIYSVESIVPTATPDELRRLGRPDPSSSPALAPYLQLPTELPARDRKLARSITAGARTEYDAVSAVETWLGTNTVYDLAVPREPDGVDAVDWFLFHTRRGFCEHIASAMVVLLRGAGIPSRIVTGYGPGERNPFTGYFEVHESDAHAWVEVLYPQVGWIPYDPTFGVPFAAKPWGTLVGQDVLAAVSRLVREVPEPVRRVAGSAAHDVVAVVRVAARSWPLTVLAAAALGAWLALRRRRRRVRHDRPPDEIGVAYDELLSALERAGMSRDPSRTPDEVLVAAGADRSLPPELVGSATVVVRTFERARYGPPARRPDPTEVGRARAVAARARATTKTR